MPILPQTGCIRLNEVSRKYKVNSIITEIISVSKSTFCRSVKDGRYSRPAKVGESCIAWKVKNNCRCIEIPEVMYEYL